MTVSLPELQYENIDLRNKLERLEEESRSMKIAAPLVATSVALSSSQSTGVEEREAALLLRSVLNEVCFYVILAKHLHTPINYRY